MNCPETCLYSENFGLISISSGQLDQVRSREREKRDRERQRETERQRDREKKERRELAFKSSEPPSPLAPPLKKAKEKTDKRLWTHSALPM